MSRQRKKQCIFFRLLKNLVKCDIINLMKSLINSVSSICISRRNNIQPNTFIIAYLHVFSQ